LESVETTTLFINFDLKQACIDQAIRGLPFNILIFLSFILFDPALAGIMAIIFGFRKFTSPSTLIF
jgi:hypothetical protein